MDLVKKGSTILLLDVPQCTLIGIDTKMFAVGPMFKGIKIIPPGTHFVYYCSANKEGNEFSPVVGFFITTNSSEEVRYCEAVRSFEFDYQLAPYALDDYGEWRQLSGYISKSTIDRIEPIGGEITVEYESGLFDEVPRTVMEKCLVEQLKHGKVLKHASEKSHKRGCYYTNIPHVVKHKNISSEELTAFNLDKSKLLETILMKDYGGSEDLILGELQFSFIAFMMGQSLEGFLQWKSIVSLFLSCTEAPFRTRTQLFLKFLRVIYYQLKHGFSKEQADRNCRDKGISLFLDDAWFSKDTFLYRHCKEFFCVVLESQAVDGDLLSWARKLKGLLETSLGWDFSETPVDPFSEDIDEFSPVVVL